MQTTTIGSICSFAVLVFLSFTVKIGAQCSNMLITFGETEIYMCRSYAHCNKRAVSGCVDNIEGIVHLRVNSEVQKFRRGAISNMKNLKSIDMRNINVEEIDPGTFSNLPSVDSISVSDNILSNIPADVFSNFKFWSIDLTSNRISNIDDFAFAFMPRLYGVYLSNNLIDTIRSNWFYNSSRIGELILSNNKLTVINSDAFSKIKRLDYLDLSFNNLHQVDDFKFESRSIDILNLAGNQLTTLTFLSHYRILRLYISMNNISYVDSAAASSAEIRNIFPHPNPWQCICLKKFWNETRALEENPQNDLNVKFWSGGSPLCVEKLHEANTCTMKEDEESKSGREVYFQTVNYSQIANRHRTPIYLVNLYDKYDNVIPL